MADNGNSQQFLRALGQLPLMARCGLLLLCVSIATAVCATVSQSSFGADGVVASVVAGAICLGAGLLGLLVTGIMPATGPTGALNQTLAGMMVRMGLPLGAFLLMYVQKSPLIDNGFPSSLIFTYLVMLVVETLLMVGQLIDTGVAHAGPAQKSRTGEGSVDG